MSDPIQPDPPQTPPGTTRRPRSARAQARQAAREAARQAQRDATAATAAVAHATEAPPLKLKPPPDVKREEAREQEQQQARGMVCSRCGKYHDISNREVGSVFECKCGKELLVAPVPENPGPLPATLVIRMRELYQKRFWAVVGMILAYPIGVLLVVITANLLFQTRNYVAGTCVGIAAIAFLWAAWIATIEYRRTISRIAAEEGEE